MSDKKGSTTASANTEKKLTTQLGDETEKGDVGKNTPGDQKTPPSDEKAAQSDEKTPPGDDLGVQSDEKTPPGDDQAAQDDQKTSEKDEKALLEDLNNRFKAVIKKLEKCRKEKKLEEGGDSDDDDELTRLQKNNENLSSRLQYARNRLLEKNQMMQKLLNDWNNAKSTKSSVEKQVELLNQRISLICVTIEQNFELEYHYDTLLKKENRAQKQLETLVQTLKDRLALSAKRYKELKDDKKSLKGGIATYEELLQEQEQRIKNERQTQPADASSSTDTGSSLANSNIKAPKEFFGTIGKARK